MDFNSASEPHDRDEEVFLRIERYRWDSESEFQQGLKNILSSCSNEEQALDITLKARCFYFSRQGLFIGLPEPTIAYCMR